MKFGRIPVAEAEGAILAHSLKLPGGAFKKGRVLSAGDLEKLAANGIAEVVAAQLEPGDVGEDEAATRVAAAIVGDGLTASAAFTGRVNLFAEAAGVVVVDAARLDRLNLADEAITAATVAPHAVVEPGQMVATVKIIPFAAPGAAVEACCAIAAEGGPVVRLAAFRPYRVALVQTRTEGFKDSILDKTVETTRRRLEALGSELVLERRGPHEEHAVAEMVREADAAGADIVLAAGASAIVDRRDVLPAGIELAGGEITHFGMPVDPGNLMLTGRLRDKPVVGLPGCARSPKFNGFDWVLQRLCAGLEVSGRDIQRMGAGGLLTEIPSRPLPRAEATRESAPAPVPRAPRIAAIVLAGGQSRRMGRANKLLSEVDGAAMVVRAVDAALASKARPVIVVTGHEADRVRAALGERPVTIVHNPDYAQGLSTSLRAGIRAVPADADGAVVCLGDMPRIAAHHIDRLIAGFNPVEGRAICVPTYDGKQGNPVLWARRFFPDMLAIDGDVGAKHLVGANAELVAEVAMPDPAVLLDVDTPQALAALKSA